MRNHIINEVLDKKVVAIVQGVYAEDCVRLAQALYEGGITLLEVTFDQSNPAIWHRTTDTISLLNQTLGDKMTFGAGTVTSVELVNLARDAGAKFIVSPDAQEDVIKATVEAGMVSMPGALTPTEVTSAHRWGADFVKLFPVTGLGAAYIKAIRGPLNHIRLLAVGGVSEKNVKEFLQAGCVGVGVGGQLVNKQWVAEGAFDKITAFAKELVKNTEI